MGFGSLRTLIRPISRTLISRTSAPYTTPFLASSPLPKPDLRSLPRLTPWAPTATLFSLTDTRPPKKPFSKTPRKKRPKLTPAGPIAWIKSVPGEPIRNQPNAGSVKNRNQKKRMDMRYAFILSEKKKRKAQMQEAHKKKMIKRVQRKMAIVGRERAWAERLAEMERLEEEYKKEGKMVTRRILLDSTLHLASN